MVAVKVERLRGLGTREGGQVIGRIAHTCPWPSPVIGVTFDNGAGFWLDCDNALEAADALEKGEAPVEFIAAQCLHDEIWADRGQLMTMAREIRAAVFDA